MKRFMMAGLLAGLCAMTGYAAEATSGSYEAKAGGRYVDLDARGNRGFVQEYDGKLYYFDQGDVEVHNQGTYGLYDFSVMDFGSGEEMGALNVDHGIFKMSAKLENMHHRMNFDGGPGLIINGAWVPSSVWNTYNVDPKMNVLFRRTETQLNFTATSPENSARWLAAEYWTAEKKGQRFAYNPTNLVNLVNLDNRRQDLTLSVGTNLGADSALSVDLIRSEFNDRAAVIGSTTSEKVTLHNYPRLKAMEAEIKWRYDVSKKLAMTAAFAGRNRESMFNGYKLNSSVGALNAAYKASEKLSLTGRFYTRVVQIVENGAWRSLVKDASHGNPLGLGQGSQLDKTTLKGEFDASYRVNEKLRLKAVYKVELNHRRDAPEEIFPAATYADGFYVRDGVQVNEVAVEDTKHTVTVRATAELPLGIEAEAGYKKLHANRPAFVNLPTRQDEVEGSLTIPLTSKVEWILLGDYSKERNANSFTHYSQTRRAYRSGLDWEANEKASVGLDGSFEHVGYITDGYFSMADNPGGAAGNYNIGLIRETGMRNDQKNWTMGAHGRVGLPKGLVAFGNGSYTWSRVRVPVNMDPTVLPYINGATNGTNTHVEDMAPGDVRIARGTVAMEFTPERNKNLTARASYTVNDWVDRYDTSRSGRASVTQVGASLKF